MAEIDFSERAAQWKEVPSGRKDEVEKEVEKEKTDLVMRSMSSKTTDAGEILWCIIGVKRSRIKTEREKRLQGHSSTCPSSTTKPQYLIMPQPSIKLGKKDI